MTNKMPITRHSFTDEIIEILKKHYGEYAVDVFEGSSILGYLNSKTKAANRGSKARGAFANHYALYVVIEDYLKKGFYDNKESSPYSKYEGMGNTAEIYFGNFGGGLSFNVKKDSSLIFGRVIGGLNKNTGFDYLIEIITFHLSREISRTDHNADKLVLEKLLIELNSKAEKELINEHH